MPLPITFVPNDIARSADVNSNFSYLSGVVGTLSTTSRADLPGDILLGPRNNYQISAKHDTSGLVNATKFLHIGSNLEYYDSGGGVYKYRRMVNAQIGMSYRFLTSGFEMWGSTGSSSADPNPTMFTVMGIYQNYLYLPTKYHISTTSTAPANNEGYRSTYTFMQSPQMVYNGVVLVPQMSVRNATNYGVPVDAIGIHINAQMWCSDSAGARLKFYREEAARNSINGFEICSSGSGASSVAGGNGPVPLGVGSYNHRFVIEVTGNIGYARVGIVGYYL